MRKVITALLIMVSLLLIACGDNAAGSNDSENTNNEADAAADTDAVPGTDTGVDADNYLQDSKPEAEEEVKAEAETEVDTDNYSDDSVQSDADVDGWKKQGDLSWSDTASAKMAYYDAVNYCTEAGGRLPSISELRTLIKDCPATQTGGNCGVVDGCITFSCRTTGCDGCGSSTIGYSVFGDTGDYWALAFFVDGTAHSWYVRFNDGSLNNEYLTATLNVRCVR